MAKSIYPLINTGKGILGVQDFRNELLLNVYYSRKTPEYPDVATVVLKNTSTGEKRVMEIENPLLRFYVLKEEKRNLSYYPEFFYIEDCDEWVVPFNDVLKYIEKIAPDSMKQYAKWCKETKNFYSLKKLHHVPYVTGTDFPYENYFRIEWLLHYADNDLNTKVTKQYLDIEVDGIDSVGVPTDGECPINAVTVVDDELNTSFTFLLRNPNNPQIEEFENDIDNFINECHAAFDESYGDLKYQIYMYDDELELIRSVFRLINTLKRDFVLIWNLPYDMPYFIARLNVLGQDPMEYICHPDFKYKYLWFKKDRIHFDFKTKKDVFRCASYTTYLDQLTNYAKVRKGQAELPSMNLTSVAQQELKDSKLDYSDEANIKTLPYVNYRKFVLYNIKDVLLQMGIERKTKDLDAIFQRAYDNATDYDSIFSQTVFLKNRVFLDYYRNLNIILGNNTNIKYDNKKDDDASEELEYELDEDGEPDWTRPIIKGGFEGALVGDPMNNAHEGEMIYGKQSMFVFAYVIDFDFSSLYPSIIISHNIGRTPLIGKVVLKDDWKHINGDPTNERFDPAKDLFEDFTTGSFSKMGERWFNLPTTVDIIKNMEDEFEKE